MVKDAWSKALGFAPQGPCFGASFRVCVQLSDTRLGPNALPILLVVLALVRKRSLARGEAAASMCCRVTDSVMQASLLS